MPCRFVPSPPSSSFRPTAGIWRSWKSTSERTIFSTTLTRCRVINGSAAYSLCPTISLHIGCSTYCVPFVYALTIGVTSLKNARAGSTDTVVPPTYLPSHCNNGKYPVSVCTSSTIPSFFCNYHDFHALYGQTKTSCGHLFSIPRYLTYYPTHATCNRFAI